MYQTKKPTHRNQARSPVHSQTVLRLQDHSRAATLSRLLVSTLYFKNRLNFYNIFTVQSATVVTAAVGTVAEADTEEAAVASTTPTKVVMITVLSPIKLIQSSWSINVTSTSYTHFISYFTYFPSSSSHCPSFDFISSHLIVMIVVVFSSELVSEALFIVCLFDTVFLFPVVSVLFNFTFSSVWLAFISGGLFFIIIICSSVSFANHIFLSHFPLFPCQNCPNPFSPFPFFQFLTPASVFLCKIISKNFTYDVYCILKSKHCLPVITMITVKNFIQSHSDK